MRRRASPSQTLAKLWPELGETFAKHDPGSARKLRGFAGRAAHAPRRTTAPGFSASRCHRTGLPLRNAAHVTHGNGMRSGTDVVAPPLAINRALMRFRRPPAQRMQAYNSTPTAASRRQKNAPN